MSDKLHIDCKERVAFDLMTEIRIAEKKTASSDRNYLLTLYQECLHAVRFPQNQKGND